MFRLILGLTGTGKTTEIFLRAMDCARQRRRTILLVPEQFSFQAERTVYTTLTGEEALSISVLSFSRLAENIFRAWGGLAKKRLTDTAKLVLMKLAVEEMKDTLQVYQRQRGRTSFLQTMLQTVEELKQSGTYPEELSAIAQELLDPQLAKKLGDIASIYGAYQAMIHRSYSDPLDDIAQSAKLAEEHRYFEGASVFIDGFSFFSPPQRQMVCAMLEQGEEVCLSFTTDGLSAGEGIDIDFYLHKQPKDKIQQRLGQQIRINRSKIKDASDTNSDFDDLDSAIRSGYFLKAGLANNEDFYYMNLLITITASDLEELQWRIQEMKKLLISQDMDLRSCYFLQEQGFLSSLPLASLDKKLYELSKRNVLTTGAASCYPFTSYSICDDNGILFGVNKHNNSLVIADIFDSKQYKNSNICILGCSGAGKTFTMQTMALRMRRKSIQVFIIAPLKGHEFYRACKNVGGEFIQISPASRSCINIMEIRKVDNSVNELLDGPTLDASALASKIQKLHIFFSLLIPDMNHEEKQLLDEALIKTYARKGITHKNESLLDPEHPDQYKAMPILEDVYDILMESRDTKRLAHILNRLVHGSASSFNQQTNVDLTNKYTVLDISELTGSSDLLTVGMFVALDYVWDKAKENRTEEKAIFVDEVWQLIGASSNRLAAEFVLEIAKIIRAYSGAGIFATQDLNDFFALDDGKYGKGIINNCKTKIILNMEDEEAQRVKHILHLSETEVMNITHFQRGNGLISTNNNNITVEFKASALEKELITTDRQELLEILARQKQKAG